MENDASSPALDYTRRLHAEVAEWYRSADNKAHILLTLNGVMLGFVGAAAFWSAEGLSSAARGTIGWEPLFFFFAYIAALAASIFAALMCLKSRLRHVEAGTLPASSANIWFFQSLPAVAPAEFLRALQGMTAPQEIAVLRSQIQILAFNVLRKHMWCNRGFVFFVLGLLCFLMVTATFTLRVFFDLSDSPSPALTLASAGIVAAAAAFYAWLDRREVRETEALLAKLAPPPVG